MFSDFKVGEGLAPAVSATQLESVLLVFAKGELLCCAVPWFALTRYAVLAALRCGVRPAC